MTNRKKEIAKFLCGFETFHALTHAVLLASWTTISVFGVSLTPTWHIVPLTVVILIVFALANYGWNLYPRRRS